jgi:hypothetical protein
MSCGKPAGERGRGRISPFHSAYLALDPFEKEKTLIGFGIHVHCPIGDDALFMVDEDDHSVGLYQSLARRYQISILDICTMLGLSLHGPNEVSLASPEHEITNRIRDAECDAALVKLELPIDEAKEIWLRAREGLRWLADNCPDPERRAKIEAFVAAKEGRMAALIAKARAKARKRLA